MKIEEGKYYVDGFGKVHGPMIRDRELFHDETGKVFLPDGWWINAHMHAGGHRDALKSEWPGLTIQEGRYYIDGHGEKRGPMKVERSYFVDERFWGFYANGKRMAIGGHDHPDHLVAEWVGPATEGPVRNVTRREIVPGTYGHVYVKGEMKNHPMGRVCLVGISSTTDTLGMTAHELRSAAMILSQLAEALDDA